MKRSEKTATRKPAKWRGLTKGSLIYLFFCRVREDFKTDTTKVINTFFGRPLSDADSERK